MTPPPNENSIPSTGNDSREQSTRTSRGGGAGTQMAPLKQVAKNAPAKAASMLDVDRAMEEITHVPASTIHRKSAFTWASRAIAGYRVCSGKVALQEGLSYLYLGEHYREAALAHGAMGEAWQPLYSEIDKAMASDRAKAFAAMRRRSVEAGK